MDTNKILRSGSYLSVIFAPIIIPIVVWILSSDKQVIKDAKHALWLHLIPAMAGILIIGLIGLAYGMFDGGHGGTLTGIIVVLLVILLAAVLLGMYIYNIVVGLRILIHD